ncbi:MAG: protocatechuate 3,4-dioxygenase subunit alpha, partial [Paracoccaceae bacterium]|nr:protocatechuate 3,4-dioxygenase subunit alpha [Paracoccaceae bacterium]
VVRQSPHISVWIVARGINLGLHTRLYFPDEDNRDDPVLALLDQARRTTLIAVQKSDAYVFDIYLQGEAETVFFDV